MTNRKKTDKEIALEAVLTAQEASETECARIAAQEESSTLDSVQEAISIDKTKIKANPELVERAKRLRGKRTGRLTRDSMNNGGPLKVNLEYYGLAEGKDITRYVHAEEPGRLEKFIRLGYEFVHDPLTGEPVVKEVRIGSEKRKSYLMRTDKDLYDQGQKEKSKRVKEGLARMNQEDEGLIVSESNINDK